MDKKEMLAIFHREQRVMIESPTVRRDETNHVIRHISLTNEPGFVICSTLSEENADQAIEEQISFYRTIEQDFEWKLYDYGQPADLKDRLEQKGFVIEETEALLVADLTDSPLLIKSVPPEIKRVTKKEEIDDIIELEDKVWDCPHTELGERLKHDLETIPDQLSIYAAYREGIVVSAAWMYFHKGTSFASLWGGSTLPAYRNKGYYSALLAIRAQEAWTEGFPLLYVDASKESRPILEKNGFQFLAYTFPCFYSVK